MKAYYWLILLLLLIMKPGYSQITPPSSEEHAVVYFLRGRLKVRFEEIINAGINPAIPDAKVFSMYDGERFIGKLAIENYIRHECKAGIHLFWSARGKCCDFVEADLAAGKVYLIHVSGIPGEGCPDLWPVYPDNDYWNNGARMFVSSQEAEEYSGEELQKMQKKHRKKIEKILNHYDNYKRRGNKSAKLTRDMYYRYPM